MLRVFLTLLILCAAFPPAVSAQDTGSPGKGKVLKVLPQFLDLQGRHTVSPSLFDRDAYQAYLRTHTNEVSGIRYEVNWKARNVEGRKVTVRVELRGLFEEKEPRRKTLETELDGRASIRRWTELKLTGEDYKQFGKITAWRATLWCNDELLDEYKSFLW